MGSDVNQTSFKVLQFFSHMSMRLDPLHDLSEKEPHLFIMNNDKATRVLPSFFAHVSEPQKN